MKHPIRKQAWEEHQNGSIRNVSDVTRHITLCFPLKLNNGIISKVKWNVLWLLLEHYDVIESSFAALREMNREMEQKRFYIIYVINIANMH